MYHSTVSRQADPYVVLGVPRDADAETIKSAYRRQAMQYHPDRNPGDAAAEEKFKELSEAYALLRDPQERARFDRYGRQTPQQRGPTAAGPMSSAGVDWRTVFTEADIPIDWSRHAGVPTTGSAVFDVLFGMMTGFMRRSGLLPGETREVPLPLTLGEAFKGASKRLTVPGPSVCAVCGGTGRARSSQTAAGSSPGPFEVATTTIGSCYACRGQGVRRGTSAVDVRVPARSTNGGKLRLKGLGGPGNPPGDLIAKLTIRLPGTAAVVAGGEVRDTLEVAPWLASSGGSTDYEGVSVKVPPRTSSGKEIRVSGAGLGGKDLVLKVRIDLLGGITRSIGNWLRKLVPGGQGA